MYSWMALSSQSRLMTLMLVVSVVWGCRPFMQPRAPTHGHSLSTPLGLCADATCLIFMSVAGAAALGRRGGGKIGTAPADVDQAVTCGSPVIFGSVAGAAALGRRGGGKMGSRSSGTPLYL
jgi:hypothetical protein